MPLGSTEVALPCGGDFTQQPNGDLVLVTDTLDVPAATIQRIARLILTNARTFDGYGNPVGRADDPLHPDWGSSARAMVGEPYTGAFVQALTAKILAALAADPSI